MKNVDIIMSKLLINQLNYIAEQNIFLENSLLELTDNLEKHPQNYNGPCNCKECK